MYKLSLIKCEDGGECEYIIKEKDISILCSSIVPYNGDKIFLTCFFSNNIYKLTENKYFAEKKNDYFAYHLGCKVIDCENSIVSLYSIEIQLGIPVPGDICNGDFVEFDVLRLDL